MNLEGKLLGNRYEIIEKIGSGGMATVYKAKCLVLKRFVAVKVLRDEFTTDEEFIKRFNKENSEKKILAVASAAAFCPAPYMAEYYATKAYLFRLVLGYRQELIDQKSKVKISILCPGPVKTNFEEVANVKFQIKSLSAEKVVKYTIKKQKKNKTVIVPGAMIKCGHFLSKFANEKFACKVLDKVAKNPNN